MSLGLSFSDFVVAGELIASVVSALRDSKHQYQQIILELHGLRRALEEVDKLDGPDELSPTINSMKAAALTCMFPLRDFLEKTRQYDSSLGGGNTSGKIKDTGRKLQWLAAKKGAVDRLRVELNAHVGIINLWLGIYQMKREQLDTNSAQTHRMEIQALLQEANDGIFDSQSIITRNHIELRSDFQNSNDAIEATRKALGQQVSWAFGDLLPKVRYIKETVKQIFATSNIIYNLVLNIHNRIPNLDMRHTWFQEPIRFEDFLGRTFPLPSEYDFEMLEAVIRAKFRAGPGKRHFDNGSFELFNSRKPKQLICPDQTATLLPGMCITMAVILTQQVDEATRCPLPSCQSQSLSQDRYGRNVCGDCGVSFDNRVDDRVWKRSSSHIEDVDTDDEVQQKPNRAEPFSKRRRFDNINDRAGTEDIECLRNVRLQKPFFDPRKRLTNDPFPWKSFKVAMMTSSHFPIVRIAKFDSAIRVNLVSAEVVTKLGFPIKGYSLHRAPMSLVNGRVLGMVKLDWHPKGSTKSYSDDFVVLDLMFSRTFDVVFPADTIGRFRRFYLANGEVF